MEKVLVQTQSKGGYAKGGYAILNNLGNDNLPKLGIEVKQKKCPVPIYAVSNPSGKSKSNYLDYATNDIFTNFRNLFNRIGKIPNDRKVTYFHFPFKPVQAKGTRVPLHLLSGAKEELKRMEKESHIEKRAKCDEDCFIRPIVKTRKKDGSIKLALDSKLLNVQIFEINYGMPNIHDCSLTIIREDRRAGMDD